jgi:RimJ/RimL family protein N-acetyltransferase
VNLSYWTYPRYRGLGYAGRAVRLACSWLLEKLESVERVEVLVVPDNRASLRVALACGFVQVGERDGHVLHAMDLRKGPRGAKL